MIGKSYEDVTLSLSEYPLHYVLTFILMFDEGQVIFSSTFLK